MLNIREPILVGEMIVGCTQCGAKFRIPDNKVSGPVKIRCNHCQNTFPISPAPPTSKVKPEVAENEGYIPREEAPDPAMKAAPILLDVPPASAPRAPSHGALLGAIAPSKEARSSPLFAGRSRPSAVQRWLWTGFVLVSFVAVGLLGVFIYQTGGRFEPRSFTRLKHLFVPERDFTVRDVSNGLYETLQGKPLFYVRGEVESRKIHGAKIRVRAEIFDGPLLVRASEQLAGQLPTPEALYAVASAQELDALVRRLDALATSVGPSERVPFFVAFYEYPPDVSQYQLRLTADEVPEPTAQSVR